MANIHIDQSSKMSRDQFLAALAAADHTQDYLIVTSHRSECSLLCEWAAHKLLYQLHILRSHTESVDLNYPQKWYEVLGYAVVGGFVLLFYR